MFSTVNLFSEKKGEINRFISLYFDKNFNLENDLYWQKEYSNPIDMIEIISTFVDNSDKFEIAFWICLDKNVFININSYTVNEIIKYLLERYPN